VPVRFAREISLTGCLLPSAYISLVSHSTSTNHTELLIRRHKPRQERPYHSSRDRGNDRKILDRSALDTRETRAISFKLKVQGTAVLYRKQLCEVIAGLGYPCARCRWLLEWSPRVESACAHHSQRGSIGALYGDVFSRSRPSVRFNIYAPSHSTP
jgi:hypothetical protein